MNQAYRQAREWQQAQLFQAEQCRDARRAAAVTRMARRAQRADRRLAASWRNAARLHDQLSRLELQPRA